MVTFSFTETPPAATLKFQTTWMVGRRGREREGPQGLVLIRNTFKEFTKIAVVKSIFHHQRCLQK
jgi:hypothetical protein